MLILSATLNNCCLQPKFKPLNVNEGKKIPYTTCTPNIVCGKVVLVCHELDAVVVVSNEREEGGGGCRLVGAPSSPLCVAPLTTIAVNHNLAPSQTSFCLNVCLRVSCSALYWNVDYVESRLLYGTDRWLDG